MFRRVCGCLGRKFWQRLQLGKQNMANSLTMNKAPTIPFSGTRHPKTSLRLADVRLQTAVTSPVVGLGRLNYNFTLHLQALPRPYTVATRLPSTCVRAEVLRSRNALSGRSLLLFHADESGRQHRIMMLKLGSDLAGTWHLQQEHGRWLRFRCTTHWLQ